MIGFALRYPTLKKNYDWFRPALSFAKKTMIGFAEHYLTLKTKICFSPHYPTLKP